MYRVFSYRNGEMKITYNEPFMEKDYPEEQVRKEITHATRAVSESFSVGIELKVHTGGRMCYGMLGAEVKPHDHPDHVHISIPVTAKNTVRYTQSMLLNDSYVYKGLPKEYLEAVIGTMDCVIGSREVYPQYDICFGNVANCEVGSSPMLFEYLTEILLNILYDHEMIESILEMSVEEFTGKYMNKLSFLHI